MLPVDPVFALVDRRGLSIKQAAQRLADARGVARGSAERMLARAKYDGRATPWFLDDLCAALGCHPYEVYGATWFEVWGD